MCFRLSHDQILLNATGGSFRRRLSDRQSDGVPTIFAKDGRGVEVVQDGAILLKRTLHLFPRHELPDLASQLHKFLEGRKTQMRSRRHEMHVPGLPGGIRERRAADLKVDVAVGQPVCTSFVQEVNVFDQQTEKGDYNLKRQKWGEKSQNCRWDSRDLQDAAPHLLSVAVGSPRAVRCPPQGRPVVVKVPSRIHLMLLHNDMQHVHTPSVIVTGLATLCYQWVRPFYL